MEYLSLRLPKAFDICVESNTAAVHNVVDGREPDAIVAEVDLPTALKRAEKQNVVLLAPGSKAVMMVREIGPSNAEKLRETIARGSGMLGFCGSGFAGTDVAHVFIPERRGESRHDFPMLGLLAGTESFGPAFRQYTGMSIADTGIQQVWVNTSYGRRVKCGWAQGPSFSGNADIVATFESPTRTPAAAIHGMRGAGHMVFSGVHPEMESPGETQEEKGNREELFWDMLDRVTPTV